jgi:uncharacterized membrane protein YdfJ with MMPL/SSD domain
MVILSVPILQFMLLMNVGQLYMIFHFVQIKKYAKEEMIGGIGSKSIQIQHQVPQQFR